MVTINIKPGHGRYTIGQTEDGEYAMMVSVSDDEKHGKVEEPEEVTPLLMMICRVPEQAEAISKCFERLAQHMREDAEEIRVGDEVFNPDNPSQKFFVTHIGTEHISGISEGGVWKNKNPKTWKKTGRRNETLAKAFTESEDQE